MILTQVLKFLATLILLTQQSTVRGGDAEPVRYWQLEARRPQEALSEPEWLEAIHQSLREAVRKRSEIADGADAEPIELLERLRPDTPQPRHRQRVQEVELTEFLKAGGVFTDDVIDGFIDLKMGEVTQLRMSTHPVEFDLYYSV